MKGRTPLGCCSKGWTVGGTPMGSGCLDRQGPGMQQGMGGSVGSGEAGVTPVGERVPRAGVLVGEAGLRPCAATPRGSPLGAGQKGELRVPLGQEGGSWVLLHRVVKHPPGEGSPRSPPSLTSYRHQCGTPHLSLVEVPVRDPPAWCWVPSQYRCQCGTPIPVPDPHPSLGFFILVQVPTWQPPPGIKPQFQYGCWCENPPIPVQGRILVLGSHPGTGTHMGSLCQY